MFVINKSVIFFLYLISFLPLQAQITYKIVDTGIEEFYNNNSIISTPLENEPFFGQDAHYQGNIPTYSDLGNGIIYDNVTELMWQQDMGQKISYDESFLKADSMTLGGYTDWRVPNIKELYSLILFTGSNGHNNSESSWNPYINTNYFSQPFGNLDAGERIIDAQTWSSTQYVGLTMNGDVTVFGVNFIDGRIKGYPKIKPANQQPNKMYFRMVRDNSEYGNNNFVDNNNGTISDKATGLMWQKGDDGVSRDWKEALAYAETLDLGGYDDWRLPNAKELHTIVDYSRSPQTTNSPAIDPLFETTEITDPNGNPGQYPYFWTGTTHLDGINYYGAAVYIAFGEAQGKMNNQLLDVHGAGAQRSDPKTGNPNNLPTFIGPQGDVRYVFNYVRCVRTESIGTGINLPEKDQGSLFIYPNPSSGLCYIQLPGFGNSHSTVEIYNSKSSRVQTIKLNGDIQALDFSTLSNGIYFYVVKSLSGITTGKFIRN